MLHVYPEKGINGLEDWKRLWGEEKAMLFDEDSYPITPKEMLEQVAERSWPTLPDEPGDYSEPGPNNLYRAKVDGHFCIGHGEGTWDLCVGEFS